MLIRLHLAVRFALLAAVALAAPPTRAEGVTLEYTPVVDVAGYKIRATYLLALPPDFEPSRPTPTLVVFPDGPQLRDDAERVLASFREPAADAGYILVVPLAPAGAAYHEGMHRVAPGLFDHLLATLPVQSDAFILAGVGSGVQSAYRISYRNTERVRGLAFIDGVPMISDNPPNVSALSEIKVRFFGDVKKSRLLTQFNRVALTFQEMRVRLDSVSMPVSREDPIGSLAVKALNDFQYEFPRPKAPSTPAPAEEASAALTALHDAASRADSDAYFDLFTTDAVFMGTDPSERWSLLRFKQYAQPRFEEGAGWTYHALRRHIYLNQSEDLAWFDELLLHDRYGLCRGSGVLRKTPEGWRVAQYNLAFTVLNDLTDGLRELREGYGIRDYRTIDQ